ncbi:uncharacterized protein [Pleurodeles waltl]|uniref:uncharacterized protein isoform X1 n=1 Tax=Pleurodeles waltl TaxID=8319 RepID=UPI00370975A4
MATNIWVPWTTDPAEVTYYSEQGKLQSRANLSAEEVPSIECSARVQCCKYTKCLKNSIDGLEAIFYRRNQRPVEEQPECGSIDPECSDLQNMLADLKIMVDKMTIIKSLCEESGQLKDPGQTCVVPSGASMDNSICKSEEEIGSAGQFVTAAAESGQLKDPDQSCVVPSGASMDNSICKSEEATGSAEQFITAAAGALSVDSGVFDSDDKNSELSNKDIYLLMVKVPDSSWKHLMRMLDINDIDIERIQRENPTDLRDQKYKMMRLWLEKGKHNKKTSRKSDISNALHILEMDTSNLVKCGSHNSAPANLC